MLETLDIVIGFTVIMSVLSLCITIIVQMVSSALALRGKNLANALALTFQTIDPKIGEHAQDLATRILKDPIFSDSIWTRKSRKSLTPEQSKLVGAQRRVLAAEKMLRSTKARVTALTGERDVVTKDLASSTAGSPEAIALNIRQSKVANDLVTTNAELTNAEKELADAKASLEVTASGVPLPADAAPGRKDPWFMWSFVHNALTMGAAIRPGEVYRILHEWAELTDAEKKLQGIPPEVADSAADLLKALGTPDDSAVEARRKLNALVEVANLFTTPGQQQAVVGAMGDFSATVERATTQAYDRFQRWFGSAQDRAEQWFTAHTRIITVVFAIAIAVLLQLDTIEIFRVLRSRPELVKELVEKAAPVVLADGEKVLDPANTPAFYTYELWFQKYPLYALKSLPKEPTADSYATALQARVAEPPDPGQLLARYDVAYDIAAKSQMPPNAANPAVDAYAAWKKQFAAYALESDPAPTDATAESIKSSLKTHIAAIIKEIPAASTPEQTAAQTQWVADYIALLPDGTKNFQEAGNAAYTRLMTSVKEAGFDLVPKEIFNRWDNETPSRCVEHWLGMAITAGLLSLGAPFWFNLLKNLMNLRPAIAKLVEKRPHSAPALPQEPGTN